MSATQLLNALFNAGVAVAIIATVLALGMSFSVPQLVAPLRRVWLVIGMIVANCLVIPAAAWGIFTVSGMQDAYVSGATLAALGAGGAAGLKAAQLAKRADLALCVSTVVVLQLANLVAVPLWASRVVSGASISAGAILKNLLVLVLIPLVIGLVIRARYADHANTWQPELVKIANLALGIGLTAGIAVNWSQIVSLLGSRVLIASVFVALIAVAVGFVVGGRDPAARASTGLVSGLRFGSLGLIIIGTQLDGNPDYLGPAMVFTLIDLLLVLLIAVETGRKVRGAATDTGSAAATP